MYDTFSNDYDRYVNWPSRLAGELPFLEKTLATAPRVGGNPQRLLDAACGTGMHAIALAQKGYQASGADLSAAMIARARQNAADAGVSVHFETLGFGALAATFGAESFEALLCLGNSLPHLLSSRELDAALGDFALCLRPGGLVVIQNRNFDAILADKSRWMEPEAHQEDGVERIFLRFYDFDPDGLITFNLITLRREATGPWAQHTANTRLRPLVQVDLIASLAMAGFVQVSAYGSLAGEPYDPVSSGNLVVVARRAG
jgi:SAM-dependent methyltransferase